MSERLPNAEQARIDPRKLRDYALSTEHILGRHKAVFFAQLGYTADNWPLLETAIRSQHLSRPAELGQASPFGQKYTITAPLRGPVGEARNVTTVWIIRSDETFPELVTLFPADRLKESDHDTD